MKKKLIVFGVVAGIILVIGVPGFFLFRGISQFSGMTTKLDKSIVQLNDFFKADPFPNPDNVKRIDLNAKQTDEWRKEVFKRCADGQFEIPRKTPSLFKNMLNETKKDLARLATSNNVTLPGDFAFGFGRYSDSGALPTPDADIPSRLAGQLVIIDTLCRMLIEEARVREIVSITRTEFPEEASAGGPAQAAAETAADGRRPAKAAKPTADAPAKKGAAPSEELFSTLHFTVEFKAMEGSIVRALNWLASSKLFVVVTSMSIEKEAVDVQEVATAAGAETAAADASVGSQTNIAVARRDRILSGPELEKPIRVRLGLDVYRFTEGETRK